MAGVAGWAWWPVLHLLAVQLAEALATVHRIAVSRGARVHVLAREDVDAIRGQGDDDSMA
ncbi:hypothetical protein [Streptomyces sp. NPDC051219]|uniref:hypothetical protein n=1 Tax=Streptomyces sp. NPDC051219 TaxID=3155283 RepID=UPI003413EFDD